VKLKLAMVMAILLLGALTGPLAYRVSLGCSYCGLVIAGFWGVALMVVLPICWGWSRTSKEVRECIKEQCHCDHEFIQEEHQEVMAWHGDCPIWCTVKISLCWKCAYSETRDFQG
jgi:hypothetical protein